MELDVPPPQQPPAHLHGTVRVLQAAPIIRSMVPPPPQTQLQQPSGPAGMGVGQSTERKVAAFKYLFLEHYFSLLTYRHKRLRRMETFHEQLKNQQLSMEEAQRQIQQKYAQESAFLRRRRLRLRFSQFRVIKKIGQGGYGEVFLCQKVDSNEICAVKRMDKQALATRKAVDRIQTERDVLATAKSNWLVRLLYSFQDETFVYLAMEYVPGGDMRTLLTRAGRLSEETARFYMAEAFIAVAALHSLGFFHRDLKPENFLVTHTGHLKLTDFGMAKGGLSDDVIANMVAKLEAIRDAKNSYRHSVERRNAFHNLRREDRARGYTIVGSPDYMAPEIVMGMEYDALVDYWALGCMLYEMVAEFPPFYSETHQQTFMDIVRFVETLERPEYEPSDERTNDRLMSDEMWHLVTRLIEHRDRRWGALTLIQGHPWFHGVVWERMHEYQAPFVPFLTSMTDTSNFDDLGADATPANRAAASAGTSAASGLLNRSPFVGFTFRHQDWMGTLSSSSCATMAAEAAVAGTALDATNSLSSHFLMDLDDL